MHSLHGLIQNKQDWVSILPKYVGGHYAMQTPWWAKSEFLQPSQSEFVGPWQVVQAVEQITHYYNSTKYPFAQAEHILKELHLIQGDWHVRQYLRLFDSIE